MFVIMLRSCLNPMIFIVFFYKKNGKRKKERKKKNKTNDIDVRTIYVFMQTR